MIPFLPALLAAALGAELAVPAGAPLADALARAAPGDLLRLGPGVHAGSLGRLAGARVEGAGAGVTVLRVPEGADGAEIAGAVSLRGLSIVAGPARCAVRVGPGGALALADVALAGGACGLEVGGGTVDGDEVTLRGEEALRVRRGAATLRGGSARGARAAVAVSGGKLALARFDVIGPSREAGVTVAGGALALDGVAIRAPGPAGIAIEAGGRVDGRDVVVAGAREEEGFPGACVQLRRGELSLRSSALAGCGAAALTASGGRVSLTAVDAIGGTAGCFLLDDRAEAELDGNLCGGRGPALAVAGGARAKLTRSRFRVDPVVWVDCGSGARVEVGAGETIGQPCAAREGGTLDKVRRP